MIQVEYSFSRKESLFCECFWLKKGKKKPQKNTKNQKTTTKKKALASTLVRNRAGQGSLELRFEKTVEVLRWSDEQPE